jgi:uncharacterized protein (TIGR02284 family)
MNLRDPVEVALNRLHVALRRAAEQYNHFAEVAEDPDLMGLLRDLAPARERMASELERQIREIGFPRMPNPERQALQRAVAAVKTAVASDTRLALVRDLEALEQEIATASTAALQENLAAPSRRLVQDIASHVVNAQERFARLKVA